MPRYWFLRLCLRLAGQHQIIVPIRPGKLSLLALKLAIAPALLVTALLVVVWAVVLGHLGR